MSNMLSDTPNDTLDYSMRMELEQVTHSARKLVPQLPRQIAESLYVDLVRSKDEKSQSKASMHGSHVQLSLSMLTSSMVHRC